MCDSNSLCAQCPIKKNKIEWLIFAPILDPFEVSIFAELASRLLDTLRFALESQNRSNFRSVFRFDSRIVEIPEKIKIQEPSEHWTSLVFEWYICVRLSNGPVIVKILNLYILLSSIYP